MLHQARNRRLVHQYNSVITFTGLYVPPGMARLHRGMSHRVLGKCAIQSSIGSSFRVKLADIVGSDVCRTTNLLSK